MLWIAVLVGALAAAGTVVLLSNSPDGPHVRPLREEKTSGKSRRDRGREISRDAGLQALPPAPRQNAGGRSKPGRRHELAPLQKVGPSAKPRVTSQRIRRARSTNPGEARKQVGPAPAYVIPATTPVPATPAPPSDPSPPVVPARSEETVTETGKPDTVKLPQARVLELVIADGHLKPDLDHIDIDDGPVTLHIRTDQSVTVQIEGEKPKSIPAGGEALITLDAAKETFEVELTRRKGVLILRVED